MLKTVYKVICISNLSPAHGLACALASKDGPSQAAVGLFHRAWPEPWSSEAWPPPRRTGSSWLAASVPALGVFQSQVWLGCGGSRHVKLAYCCRDGAPSPSLLPACPPGGHLPAQPLPQRGQGSDRPQLGLHTSGPPQHSMHRSVKGQVGWAGGPGGLTAGLWQQCRQVSSSHKVGLHVWGVCVVPVASAHWVTQGLLEWFCASRRGRRGTHVYLCVITWM